MDLDASEQRWQFLGINSGIVGFWYGLQNVAGANLGGWIALGISVGDTVAKNLSDGLQSSFGNIPRAAILNSIGHRDQFRRLDLCNRPRS